MTPKGYDRAYFYKTLLLLALPIILQDVVSASVGLAGNFFMGSLGLYEINAVSLANQLFFLYSLLIFGINSGSSIFMAQFWGKGDIRNIRATMGICFALGMFACLVFSGIAFLAPERFLRFYSSGNEEVTKIGAGYLRIVAACYFIHPFTMTINTSLRSIRQTKIPMFSICSSLLINAVLSYTFVFRLGLGVPGFAYAGLISKSCELLISVTLVVKYRLPILGKIGEYFSADRAFIKRFLKTAIWVVFNEFGWAAGTSLYNHVYGLNGAEGLGAAQIAYAFQNLFSVFGSAIGSAGGILISNALGEGEHEKAKAAAFGCLKAVASVSAVLCFALVFLSPFLIRQYNVSEAVKADAIRLLLVMAFGMMIKTFNYTAIVGVLRSGGDTLFCFLLDVLTVWLIALPISYVGAGVFRLNIIWVVFLVHMEEFIKMFIGYYRVVKFKWVRSLVGGDAA